MYRVVENMEVIMNYSYLFFCIVMLLIWITMIAIILIMWIGSQIENEKFFKAVQRSLEFKDIDDIRNGIKNDFEVYRNRRYGFKSKTIIELCQEFDRKLKLQEDDIRNKNYIHKLEAVISILKDEYKFDDEKMNKLVENVQGNSGIEDARILREYLIRLNAYNEGILFEKERTFKDMQERLARKKWISNLGYAIGIIGSIASIYSLFFAK